MRNSKEIQAEIETLRAMRPKIPKETFFGDDNLARIDAQIKVLEDRMDEDEVQDEYFNDEDYELFENAEEARLWMEGEGAESPSVGWAPLVRD